MPRRKAGTRPIDPALTERVQALADDFERAWETSAVARTGPGYGNVSWPALDEFLATLDEAVRPIALATLAPIDLERRLKFGEDARFEAYLEAFPDLQGDAEAVRDLVLTEYRCTLFRGEDPPPEGFEARHAACFAAAEGPAFPLLDELRTLRARQANDPARPRFRPIRSHYRGGMGLISEAYDRELGRVVALKVCPSERPDDQARLAREALITGRLQHPMIVPVYALSRGRGGKASFAMPFIRGGNLEQAIDRLHAPKGVSRDREWALRDLLRRFVDVCNAIEFAHSRGVIHRDLKPRNIMVGNYGETLVVDWGLAKYVGPLEPSAVGGSGAGRGPAEVSTQVGTTVGTPAYMSPEQAEGKPDRDTPATDVYGLGATLYHLLCGKAPFRGTTSDILRRVQVGDFLRPTEATPGVPRPLEAICLKAMALKREDRYPSAAMLAEDVEQCLSDRPVSAHSESPRERALRWGRRNISLAAGLAAAVVLISGCGAVVLGVVIWSGLQLSEKNRDLAASNGLVARAVSTLKEVVPGDDGPGDHRQAEEIARLFDTIKSLHDSRGRRPDAEVAREDARACLAFGIVFLKVGSIPGAIDAFARARALLRGALDDHSGKSPTLADGLREDLADACQNLGEARGQAGEYPSAIEAFNEARSLLQAMVDAPGLDPKADAARRLKLAEVDLNLGAIARQRKAFDESEQAYLRAIQNLEGLRKTDPDDARVARALGVTYNNLGNVRGDAARPGQAIEAFRKAIEFLDPLRVRSSRENGATAPSIRRELALARYNLARLSKDDGRFAEARDQLKAAIEDQEALIREQTAGSKLNSDLAASYLQLARILQAEEGQSDEAVRKFEAALRLLDVLIQAHPGSLQYARERAATLGTLGLLRLSRSEPGHALVAIEEAARVLGALVADHPDASRLRNELAQSYASMAIAHRDAGEPALALADESKGVAVLEAMIRLNQNDHREPRHVLRFQQVWANATIGEGRLGRGDLPGASSSFDQALTLYEANLADDPSDLSAQVLPAMIFRSLEAWLARHGDGLAPDRREKLEALRSRAVKARGKNEAGL